MPFPKKALHDIVSLQIKNILIDKDTIDHEDKKTMPTKYKEEGENNHVLEWALKDVYLSLKSQKNRKVKGNGSGNLPPTRTIKGVQNLPK